MVLQTRHHSNEISDKSALIFSFRNSSRTATACVSIVIDGNVPIGCTTATFWFPLCFVYNCWSCISDDCDIIGRIGNANWSLELKCTFAGGSTTVFCDFTIVCMVCIVCLVFISLAHVLSQWLPGWAGGCSKTMLCVQRFSHHPSNCAIARKMLKFAFFYL